jgi:hypothetical protein
MLKGKAFFVVGHKDWGKSSTLKALTDGSRFPRTWVIASIAFFVRRMSNDDFPESLIRLANRLHPQTTPHVIATLCPTFNDKKARPALLDTLNILKRKYELFFFVLRHKCSNRDLTIPDDETEKLERYGTVEVFRPEGARSEEIARAFQHFIEQHV